MKKIISILFMLALLGTTAFAAGGTAYDIDVDNHEVTISGTAAANEDVLIIVLKPADVADSDNAANVALFADKTFFSTVKSRVDSLLKTGDAAINETNFNNYKLHFTHVLADAEGNYSLTLPVPADASNDIVYLLITTGGSYANDFEAIAVYSPSDATIATAEAAVNTAGSGSALIPVIAQYDTVFGLDTESNVYKMLNNDIANAIVVMRGGNPYTSFTDLTDPASFKSDFNEALAYYTRQTDAVNEINGATADSLKTILETYSQGVNVLGYYGGAKLNFNSAYDTYGYLEVNRLLVGRSYANMPIFIDAFNAAVAELALQATDPAPGTPQNPSRPDGPNGGFGGGSSVPTTKPPVVEGESSGFTDLDQAAWAEESILNLVGRGVVDGMGDGTFNPNGNVTREQFVKMLLLSFGIEVSSTSGPFADVDGSAWYAPYVNTAYELGIVNGISDSDFGVGRAITRQDLVTMIVRACDAYGLEISKTQAVSFTDEGQIADYAYDAVMDLAAAGVINGVSEGIFAPLDNTTRAQVAVILDRLYNV